MQYSEGSLGRIFVIRIDDGEDFIESITSFALEKNVHSGLVIFLGALRKGMLVTGPKDPIIPPTPHYETFKDAWETLGMATIYPGEKDEPTIHIHASAGKGQKVLTGCLRDKAETYLIIEAILIEFYGLGAKRVLDETMGLQLLSLDKRLP